MYVGIDESGYDDTLFGIELPGSPCRSLDFIAGRYKDDPPVTYQHCFGFRTLNIHSQNAPIDQRQVVATLGQCLSRDR